MRGKNVCGPKDSPHSDLVSSQSAAISKHKMSHSLTILIITSAVHLISCTNINNPEDCVLVVSAEDQTLKRCVYFEYSLAKCDNNEFVEVENCLPKPRTDSRCLTCSAVKK